MKKGLIITLITCLVLLFLGAGLLIIGVAKGGKLSFDLDYKNHRVVTPTNVEMRTGEKKVDAFESIKIDVEAAEISIVEGDEYCVSYKLYEAQDPIINVDSNKQLIVTRNNDGVGKLQFRLSDLFKEGNTTPKITVTVPEGTKLTACKLDTNAGDVRLDGIALDELNVDSDAGNIKLENMEMTSLDVNANAGNIAIKDSSVAKVKLDADAGNVNIKSLISDSIAIDMNYGNLDISDSDIKKIVAELDAGNSNFKSINTEFVKVDANYGSIDMSIIGEEPDYTIKTDVNYGKLKINGEEQGGKIEIKRNSDKRIEVDADAGDVSIDFE